MSPRAPTQSSAKSSQANPRPSKGTSLPTLPCRCLESNQLQAPQIFDQILYFVRRQFLLKRWHCALSISYRFPHALLRVSRVLSQNPIQGWSNRCLVTSHAVAYRTRFVKNGGTSINGLFRRSFGRADSGRLLRCKEQTSGGEKDEIHTMPAFHANVSVTLPRAVTEIPSPSEAIGGHAHPARSPRTMLPRIQNFLFLVRSEIVAPI